MAILKHFSSKNADYGAAEKYLLFQHDEFTMKPVLDETGRLIPREDYRLSTLNCGGEDFAVACMRANLRYEKNQRREDVKSHHYTQILSICIFLVIYGRMIEVYLVTSIGPIPFATMVNREWGSTGQNYLRSLLALGFQAFLIMICVGIYAVLVEGISTSGDNISAAIWGCMGYTVLLCYTLFKTGSLAKFLFGAH